ncbi:MAG TPA: hypothetical protein VKD91_15760 [Pyrinomonadaceae bacterium]|nr:hypothetical protein [Pyrinomonadaceae bacterium]
MRKSTIYIFFLGLAVVVLTAFGSAGLVVSAQNSNSSAMTNTAAAKPKPKKPRVKTGGRCDPAKQEQADLSGTYNGKAKHGTEPAQDATLTIDGNNFTMTSGSETHTGRVTAVTTCGYTAVTMMMGDLTPPAPSPNPPAALPAMSLRAKKVGKSLTLTSVPGEPKSVWFSTSGSGMKAKPKKHKAKAKTDTAAPAKTTP